MQNFKFAQLAIVAAAAVGGIYYIMNEEPRGTSTYKTQLDDFRRNREERLRAPDGWLSVVGLHWLRSGANTIGAGSTNAIRLPDGAPSELGRILFNDDRSAKIQLSTADGVLIEGEPGEAGKTYDLFSDAAEKATQLTVGENIRFFLVDRPNGVGVRVKDANSETRKKFAGNRWYEPKSEFIVEADWVAQETEIEIPDILGNRNMERAPGYAKFKIDGVEQKLYPTLEGNDLFFVFRDDTSGLETYGAARFLYAKAAQNGKVTLDFNKSINPPCAFTRFATCPLPPKENILNVAIRAGELTPESH